MKYAFEDFMIALATIDPEGVDNYNNEKRRRSQEEDTKTQIQDFVGEMCSWDSTKKGSNYWSDMHTKMHKYQRNLEGK